MEVVHLGIDASLTPTTSRVPNHPNGGRGSISHGITGPGRQETQAVQARKWHIFI